MELTTTWFHVDMLVRFNERMKASAEDKNDVWRVTKVKRVNVDIESTTRPGKSYVASKNGLREASALDKEIAPPPPPKAPVVRFNPGVLVFISRLSAKGYRHNQEWVVLSDRGERVKVAMLGGESNGGTWTCPREGITKVPVD